MFIYKLFFLTPPHLRFIAAIFKLNAYQYFSTCTF